MSVLIVILRVMEIATFSVCIVAIIRLINKGKRKDASCNTCKWLTSKNTSEYYTYTCNPNGGLFSEWHHKPPEYCKYYSKRDGGLDDENT